MEFKRIGRKVKIYGKSKIMKPEVIEFGDFSEIDVLLSFMGERN